MVAGVILLLSAIAVNNSVLSWVASSMRLSELTGLQIKSFLLVLLEDASSTRTPPTLEDAKRQWTQLMEHDDRLYSMLVATLAQVPAIAEVSVGDLRERIIASSNTSRIGAPVVKARSLAELQASGAWARFSSLFSRSEDFEQRILLGLPGEQVPVFTIQVLVSNALLRDAIWPDLRAILAAACASLLAAGMLMFYVARRGTHHLSRISQLIDRIAEGRSPEQDAAEEPGGDLAVVESKLNLLGTQYRGAVRDAAALRGNMAALLQGLSDVTLLLDPEGRVILAGGPCERLLGVAPVVGEVFPIRAVRDAARERRPVQDQPLKHGDGRMAMSIDFLPDSSAALVRIRDAEGSRRLEQELAASSRLDAINRLTGGVAHEIKNPLNSISARLALLESMVEEVPEAGEELRVISQEVDRLDHVVRTFLDFTHPVELEREDVDLGAMIRDLAALVTPQASGRGIAVQVEAPGAELIVMGDSGLLKQAFMNVVSNALEAMPEGGRLVFRLERLGGECRLTVSDTGEGIPAEKRERIFQLYYTTKKGGSGIGLAVTFRAVELHGGRIEVESEPGRGTSFRVALPLKPVVTQ